MIISNALVVLWVFIKESFFAAEEAEAEECSDFILSCLFLCKLAAAAAAGISEKFFYKLDAAVEVAANAVVFSCFPKGSIGSTVKQIEVLL